MKYFENNYCNRLLLYDSINLSKTDELIFY